MLKKNVLTIVLSIYVFTISQKLIFYVLGISEYFKFMLRLGFQELGYNKDTLA